MWARENGAAAAAEALLLLSRFSSSDGRLPTAGLKGVMAGGLPSHRGSVASQWRFAAQWRLSGRDDECPWQWTTASDSKTKGRKWSQRLWWWWRRREGRDQIELGATRLGYTRLCPSEASVFVSKITVPPQTLAPQTPSPASVFPSVWCSVPVPVPVPVFRLPASPACLSLSASLQAALRDCPPHLRTLLWLRRAGGGQFLPLRSVLPH
jgi:hypothetical protein